MSMQLYLERISLIRTQHYANKHLPTLNLGLLDILLARYVHPEQAYTTHSLITFKYVRQHLTNLSLL